MFANFRKAGLQPDTRNKDREKRERRRYRWQILAEEDQQQRKNDRHDPDEQKPANTGGQFNNRYRCQINGDAAAKQSERRKMEVSIGRIFYGMLDSDTEGDDARDDKVMPVEINDAGPERL